jgi:hypothetical protein
MTKVIVINSEKQTIEFAEISNYKDIYPLIGNDCDTFCCPVSFDNADTLYADDEALYHPYQGGIMMPDWNYPLLGNFVIVGTDENGENQDVQSTLEYFRENVRFFTYEDVQNWYQPRIRKVTTSAI